VIGKCGDIDGVWIEPVTAQVMMTLFGLATVHSFNFLSHRSLSKQLPIAEGLLYLRRRFLGLSSSAKADDPVILTGRGLATHQKQSTTGGYWMPAFAGMTAEYKTTPALTAAKS
jgi:hypothetical protein